MPENFTEAEVRELLRAQGYTRILDDARHGRTRRLRVVQDRRSRSERHAERTGSRRCEALERGRVLEALEAALRVGRGRVNVHVVDDADAPHSLECWRYSTDLHCADCDISLREPVAEPASRSTRRVGACETCRGFGRTIGIDYGLVIPDESKIAARRRGRPWQTESLQGMPGRPGEVRARSAAFRSTSPWRELSAAHRAVGARRRQAGELASWHGVWYGVKRFFDWLETQGVQDARARAAVALPRLHARARPATARA